MLQKTACVAVFCIWVPDCQAMKARLRAFSIHLAGSAFLALLAIAVVFLVWYPAPLQKAAGVTGIFLLIMGVDVTIGPVLTLIVYAPGKKMLRFDLATIVALQLLAFGYGIWTVAEGRPAWLVFSADRFDLVRANEIDDRRLGMARPEYRNVSWLGPKWVCAQQPDDQEQRNAILFEAAMAGIDLPQRPDLYRPLSEDADRMRSKARPMEQLLSFNSPEAVEAVRTRWPDADTWLPLMSNAKAMTVLLRKGSAEVIAVVDLNPWD